MTFKRYGYNPTKLAKVQHQENLIVYDNKAYPDEQTN